ncbi:hypothetical protein [Photorhabdus asymbiotica]|uniref:hypothetical protein n=1 Tax=Photorhabdus asymbiotica TaxID=291112 RepID=UPI003DA7105D
MNKFIKPIVVVTLILLLPSIAAFIGRRVANGNLWRRAYGLKYWIIFGCDCYSEAFSRAGKKRSIKNTVKEPRPYIVWSAKNYQVPAGGFYQHQYQRKQRAKLLEQYLRIDHRIPQWQLIHWKNETAEIDFELQRGS